MEELLRTLKEEDRIVLQGIRDRYNDQVLRLIGKIAESDHATADTVREILEGKVQSLRTREENRLREEMIESIRNYKSTSIIDTDNFILTTSRKYEDDYAKMMSSAIGKESFKVILERILEDHDDACIEYSANVLRVLGLSNADIIQRIQRGDRFFHQALQQEDLTIDECKLAICARNTARDEQLSRCQEEISTLERQIEEAETQNNDYVLRVIREQSLDDFERQLIDGGFVHEGLTGE